MFPTKRLFILILPDLATGRFVQKNQLRAGLQHHNVGLESAEVSEGKAAKRSPSGISGNPTRQVYPVTISHLLEKASFHDFGA